jgi:hypothetical protein
MTKKNRVPLENEKEGHPKIKRIFLIREYYHKNLKNKSVYRIVYRIVHKTQGKRFFSFPAIKIKTFVIQGFMKINAVVCSRIPYIYDS